MLYFLISMIVLIGLCDRAARYSRIESILLKSRFRLFATRDKLRLKVIEDEIESDKWFDYLDTTITKTIDFLPSLTLWEGFILLISYQDNQSILDAQVELSETLEKPEYYELKQIYRKYLAIVAEHILYRHRVLGYTFYYSAIATGSVRSIKNKMVSMVASAPETSTLHKYC